MLTSIISTNIVGMDQPQNKKNLPEDTRPLFETLKSKPVSVMVQLDEDGECIYMQHTVDDWKKTTIEDLTAKVRKKLKTEPVEQGRRYIAHNILANERELGAVVYGAPIYYGNFSLVPIEAEHIKPETTLAQVAALTAYTHFYPQRRLSIYFRPTSKDYVRKCTCNRMKPKEVVVKNQEDENWSPA
jgi:hypothetical protein